MQIFFKTMVKSFALDLDGEDTIQQVKQKVQEAEGIPSDQQRLVLAGKELEEGRTLADYNVREGSTFNIVMRL